MRAVTTRYSRAVASWGGHVGQHTENRQNPVLIDFAGEQDINIAIPGANPKTVTETLRDVPMKDVKKGDDLALWFNEYLQVVYKKNSQN